MSSGKKTLLVLAGIAVMLVTVAFSAFVVLVHDESPPPDDSDLVLVRPQVPDDQNAWTFYAKAGEKVTVPKEDEYGKWLAAPASAAPPPAGTPSEKAPEPPEWPPYVKARWVAICDNKAWEQPLVDEVLKRNAEALAIGEKGLAAPECLLPEVNDPRDNISWINAFIDVARLVSVRARNLARQGNDEAAWDDAMRMVRFGHHMEGGRGALIGYLVGNTIKGMGCDLMRELASKSGLAPDRLRRYAAELAPYGEDPRSLAESLRGEYTFYRNVLKKVASGQLDIGDLKGYRWRREPLERLTDILFKPHRTRRLMAEAYREMIAAAPMHFADVPDLGNKFHAMAWREQQITSGNYTGGTLLSCLMGGELLHRRKCQTNVQVAATRILLAMKAFKMEKGRLPATLQELVPEYLEAVPLDDFDGKPLRYNPAKKILYTVGKDLRDEGGTTTQEFLDAIMKERDIDPKTADPDTLKSLKEECEDIWNWPDPSFPIEF